MNGLEVWGRAGPDAGPSIARAPSSLQNVDGVRQWKMESGSVKSWAVLSRFPWALPTAGHISLQDAARSQAFLASLLHSVRTPLPWQAKPSMMEQWEVLEMLPVRNMTPDYSLVSQRSWVSFFHPSLFSDATQENWSGGGSFYRSWTCQTFSFLPKKWCLPSCRRVSPLLYGQHTPLAPHQSIHGWRLLWLSTVLNYYGMDGWEKCWGERSVVLECIQRGWAQLKWLQSLKWAPGSSP